MNNPAEYDRKANKEEMEVLQSKKTRKLPETVYVDAANNEYMVISRIRYDLYLLA